MRADACLVHMIWAPITAVDRAPMGPTLVSRLCRREPTFLSAFLPLCPPVFCCVGALAIAGALHLVDRDLLGSWLAERQGPAGGLNGRPEKEADVCYSWWVLACLAILDRMHWVDHPALQRFILHCQDGERGGIADRPDDMADVFHTFFGIGGLSLLGYGGLEAVDPAYALPTATVDRIFGHR